MKNYEPKISNEEIRKLIKVDENNRRYISIKEYDELVEKYKNVNKMFTIKS